MYDVEFLPLSIKERKVDMAVETSIDMFIPTSDTPIPATFEAGLSVGRASLSL